MIAQHTGPGEILEAGGGDLLLPPLDAARGAAPPHGRGEPTR